MTTRNVSKDVHRLGWRGGLGEDGNRGGGGHDTRRLKEGTTTVGAYGPIGPHIGLSRRSGGFQSGGQRGLCGRGLFVRLHALLLILRSLLLPPPLFKPFVSNSILSSFPGLFGYFFLSLPCCVLCFASQDALPLQYGGLFSLLLQKPPLLGRRFLFTKSLDSMLLLLQSFLIAGLLLFGQSMLSCCLCCLCFALPPSSQLRGLTLTLGCCLLRCHRLFDSPGRSVCCSLSGSGFICRILRCSRCYCLALALRRFCCDSGGLCLPLSLRLAFLRGGLGFLRSLLILRNSERAPQPLLERSVGGGSLIFQQALLVLSGQLLIGGER